MVPESSSDSRYIFGDKSDGGSAGEDDEEEEIEMDRVLVLPKPQGVTSWRKTSLTYYGSRVLVVGTASTIAILVPQFEYLVSVVLLLLLLPPPPPPPPTPPFSHLATYTDVISRLIRSQFFGFYCPRDLGL